MAVAGRQKRIGDTELRNAPVDAERRIVPAQDFLVGRTIERVAFVKEIRALGADDEAVREAARYKELPPVVLIEIDGDVPADVGLPTRTSTATSRTAPRSTVTSLPCGLGS